jgi:hypothetical protein
MASARSAPSTVPNFHPVNVDMVDFPIGTANERIAARSVLFLLAPILSKLLVSPVVPASALREERMATSNQLSEENR